MKNSPLHYWEIYKSLKLIDYSVVFMDCSSYRKETGRGYLWVQYMLSIILHYSNWRNRERNKVSVKINIFKDAYPPEIKVKRRTNTVLPRLERPPRLVRPPWKKLLKRGRVNDCASLQKGNNQSYMKALFRQVWHF